MTTHTAGYLKNDVVLRDVIETDLPIFFEHQSDPEAGRMAAFPARDLEAFMAHWAKILADETASIKTVLVDGQVAGNVVGWANAGERDVGYWLGKEYWGRGIATRALLAFLEHIKERPVYAYVAKHNIASVRVLEKCGFKVVGEDQGFPDEHGRPVEEFVLKLES